MDVSLAMRSYKRFYITRMVLSLFTGVLIGVLFLIAKEYAGEVFDVLLIAVGLTTFALNFFLFFCSLLRIKQKGEWISLALSLAAMVLGVLLMLLRGDGILLALGAFTILLPLVRVLLVEDHKQCLKRETPKIVFGVLIIVISLIRAEELVFLIGAIAVFAASVLYFLWGMLSMRLRLAAVEEQMMLESESGAQTPAEYE